MSCVIVVDKPVTLHEIAKSIWLVKHLDTLEVALPPQISIKSTKTLWLKLVEAEVEVSDTDKPQGESKVHQHRGLNQLLLNLLHLSLHGYVIILIFLIFRRKLLLHGPRRHLLPHRRRHQDRLIMHLLHRRECQRALHRHLDLLHHWVPLLV